MVGCNFILAIAQPRVFAGNLRLRRYSEVEGSGVVRGQIADDGLFDLQAPGVVNVLQNLTLADAHRSGLILGLPVFRPFEVLGGRVLVHDITRGMLDGMLDGILRDMIGDLLPHQSGFVLRQTGDSDRPLVAGVVEGNLALPVRGDAGRLLSHFNGLIRSAIIIGRPKMQLVPELGVRRKVRIALTIPALGELQRFGLRGMLICNGLGGRPLPGRQFVLRVDLCIYGFQR